MRYQLAVISTTDPEDVKILDKAGVAELRGEGYNILEGSFDEKSQRLTVMCYEGKKTIGVATSKEPIHTATQFYEMIGNQPTTNIMEVKGSMEPLRVEHDMQTVPQMR